MNSEGNEEQHTESKCKATLGVQSLYDE